MNPVTPIPIPAWEQGLIVVVFGLVLGGMSAGFYAILRALVVNFQNFIITRDKLWQDHADKREHEFNIRNGIIVEAVKSLADTIERLSDKMDSHNDITTAAIAKMEERTQPLANRRSRGKAGAD